LLPGYFPGVDLEDVPEKDGVQLRDIKNLHVFGLVAV
jgi:hypothetical protein